MAWDTLFCSSDRCSPAPQSRWSCWTSWPPASTWPPPPSHPTTRCPSPPPGRDNGRPNVTFYNWKHCQKDGFRVCLPQRQMSSLCLFFPFKSFVFVFLEFFCLCKVFDLSLPDFFSRSFCHQESFPFQSFCFCLSRVIFAFAKFLICLFQIFSQIFLLPRELLWRGRAPCLDRRTLQGGVGGLS